MAWDVYAVKKVTDEKMIHAPNFPFRKVKLGHGMFSFSKNSFRTSFSDPTLRGIEFPANGYIKPEQVSTFLERAKERNSNPEITRFLQICYKKGYGIYSWS